MSSWQDLQNNVFYRHFDLPSSFPLIGLLGDSWQFKHEPVKRMHFHNCLEIGYLYNGSGQYFIFDRIVNVKAPCFVIAPPNAPHVSIVDEGANCSWKWLYLDPIILLPHLGPRLANAITKYQYSLAGSDCVFSACDHPQLYLLLEMIIKELEDAKPYFHNVVQELFQAFFLKLLRISPTATNSKHSVNARLGCIAPAVSYIAENYPNEITIESLSKLCHISTSHFRRLFKQIFGWAPLDYLQIVRIDRACAMLFNCDKSITDIGNQVGYPSSSSFNRQFKRIHGIAPGQWRQKMQSEENPVVTAYLNSLPPSILQFFPSEDPPEKDTVQTKAVPKFC